MSSRSRRTSESDALAVAKRIGLDVEALVVEAIDPLRAVPDDAAEWHDAVAVELVDGRHDVRLGGTPLVELGTAVEIKAARVSTSNGDGTCPGRWYMRRRQHDQLVADAAAYALALYREGAGSAFVLVDVILVPASIVDEHLAGRWYETGDGEEVAKLSWPLVFGDAVADEVRA